MQSDSQLDALVADLKSQADDAFPKACDACGRPYDTLEAFLSNTNEILASDTPAIDADGVATLERACSCGEEVSVRIRERRSHSDLAQKRRDLFGHLLSILTEEGMPPGMAKNEILKVMHGEPSSLLTRQQLERLFS